MSAHAHLRQATRAAHDRIDRSFAVFDLTDRAQYAAFLSRHAAAFIPAEAALTQAGADTLVHGWSELVRAPSLRADLDDLGMAPPPPRPAPAYGDDAAIFGGAYVLEGSRLGGAVLRNHVGRDFPRRFLDSIQPPGRWRGFIAQLNQRLYETAAVDRATKAALDTFALFEFDETGRD